MLIAVLFAGVGVVGLVVWKRDRRTIRRWAESRPPTTWEQLTADLLRAGASEQTAEFVREELAPYYRYGLTPYPEDQLFSTLRIDPEDVEEMAGRYWQLRGLQLPSPADPVVVPRDPTLLEFAIWLEHSGSSRLAS